MGKKEYSKELADCVKRHLDKNGWRYSFDEARGVFEFNLNIRSIIQRRQYIVDIHEKEIFTYAMYSICADKHDVFTMNKIAEFICRANYGPKPGCFEFDFRNGEIRYKNYIDCEGVIPSDEVIRNSISMAERICKTYASGIVDIIFSGADASQAIEKCEKSAEDSEDESEEDEEYNWLDLEEDMEEED